MKRILIIDDHQESADILASMMDFDGHITKVACGGIPGLREMKNFDPHIVFLDISMPDMDGNEVAALIRKDGDLRQPYLVAFTNFTDAQMTRKFKQVGFDLYLAKSISVDVLMDAIKEIVL